MSKFVTLHGFGNSGIGTSEGVELNFDVIGGTTRPVTPNENTFWINTNTPVQSWIFSATQPSDPIDGMVWIKTGITSLVEFNALVENNITIYPSSTRQYENGEWVAKHTELYQNNTWNVFSVIPDFTYTGDYEIVDDSDNTIVSSVDNWKIRFLTSGFLTFHELKGAEDGIDVFCVGGGAGGGGTNYGGLCSGGGGGGFTSTGKGITVNANQEYEITVGAGGAGGSNQSSSGGSGGQSSAFSVTAKGGSGARTKVYGVGTYYTQGGNGGCGGGGGGNVAGNGGSNGGGGGSGTGDVGGGGGSGQGTTTREFGESNAKLYAGGGGGGGGGATNGVYDKGGNGGAGGGGTGGGYSGNAGKTNGTANTGGGGGGSHGNTYTPTGANGGSGIVIIRNARG